MFQHSPSSAGSSRPTPARDRAPALRTVVVAADEIRRRACHLCLTSDARHRYMVLDANTGSRVVELFGEIDIDVLLLSSRLAGLDAVELLADLQRLRPGQPLPVILLAEDYEEPAAIAAVDRWGLDIVPWRDLDRFVLRRAVDLTIERSELRGRLREAERALAAARRREARLQEVLGERLVSLSGLGHPIPDPSRREPLLRPLDLPRTATMPLLHAES